MHYHSFHINADQFGNRKKNEICNHSANVISYTQVIWLWKTPTNAIMDDEKCLKNFKLHGDFFFFYRVVCFHDGFYDCKSLIMLFFETFSCLVMFMHMHTHMRDALSIFGNHLILIRVSVYLETVPGT